MSTDLTDDELMAMWNAESVPNRTTSEFVRAFARAAIAADRERRASSLASTEDLSAERAAFEAWFAQAGDWREPLTRSGRGYGLAAANWAWGAWQARASSAAAVPGWKPIETAPKNTDVLVLCSHGQYVANFCEHDIEYWHVDDNKHGPFPLRGASPTHWMPLPPAPGAAPPQAVPATDANEPHEEMAGLSWDGYDIHGTVSSIREVQRLIHEAGRAKELAAYLAFRAPAASTATDAGILDAPQDALSVCSSVRMSNDRRITVGGTTMFAQTEEWCKWAEYEVAPKIDAAIKALAALRAVGAGSREPLTEEQIKAAILPIAADGPAVYLALCYESGPYSITELRPPAVAIARAIEAAHGIAARGKA